MTSSNNAAEKKRKTDIHESKIDKEEKKSSLIPMTLKDRILLLYRVVVVSSKRK